MEEHLGAQSEVEEGMERVYVDVVGQVGTGFSGAVVGWALFTSEHWVGNGPEQSWLLLMPSRGV